MTRNLAILGILAIASTLTAAEPKMIRVGMIGLDTSHSTAFTRLLNNKDAPPELANCRVVAAYPHGSPDIQSSVSRIPKYTEEVKKLGVEIVDSIEELLTKVDAVLLETNDGRPHLEQAKLVFAAKKPVFIDKPLAASLKDCVAIFKEAERTGTPVFSSSSLRFGKNTQAVRGGSIGKVTFAETGSPVKIEKTHPDLYWYGIHGVESLFAVMGPGCVSISRKVEDGKVVVTGKWNDGRTGVFREFKGYNGHAKGEKKTVDVGAYNGYDPLVVEIVKFFRTGKPPVTAEETLEIYAFMSAADISKEKDGAEVMITDVLKAAQ